MLTFGVAGVQVFEKGNFAGLEEMKKNDRLFRRVAPMGVADIMLAVQYPFQERAPLDIPIIAFDGLLDYTIQRGNMEKWAAYTSKPFRNVPIRGDHYFVSTHFRQVRPYLCIFACHAHESCACPDITLQGFPMQSWQQPCDCCQDLPQCAHLR